MSAVLKRDMEFPDKLVPLLQPKRFKIIYGGRGSAKSHTVAQMLLMLGTRRKLRILCVREVQKTLADSSMQVLKDYIERLGLGGHYQVLKNEIRGWNGTTFAFTGLKDHTADSLKSYEGVDLVWIEEAHSVSERSWNILIPTVRKETGGPFDTGSEIWATFNPDQETDHVYKRFVLGKDADAVVIPLNWRDNPWFGKIMNTERLKMKALNDDIYQHIWEGRCRSAAGLMFKRKWFKFYDHVPEFVSVYMSSDYAGAPDPDAPEREPDFTEFGIFGLDTIGDLYILDWFSEQCDASVWINAAFRLIRAHKPKIWFEEKGGILRALDGTITTRMRASKAKTFRKALASAGNKADRALGFMALCSTGSVWLPKIAPDKPWVERLVNQLCAFTGQDGKVDDGVDVCSLLARGIDEMANAREPTASKRKQIIPFTRSHFEMKDPDDEDRAERQRNVYR